MNKLSLNTKRPARVVEIIVTLYLQSSATNKTDTVRVPVAQQVYSSTNVIGLVPREHTVQPLKNWTNFHLILISRCIVAIRVQCLRSDLK